MEKDERREKSQGPILCSQWIFPPFKYSLMGDNTTGKLFEAFQHTIHHFNIAMVI